MIEIETEQVCTPVDKKELFKKLRCITTRPIFPYGLDGIQETADRCEEIFKKYKARVFWNMAPRKNIADDIIFVGLVIQRLNSGLGREGINLALSIIKSLEDINVNSNPK